MKEKITGSHALMQSLIAEGVDTIFGYPGGQIMPTFDALFDYAKEINHILVRHEQGAVHAAEGYARVSGRVGVALVTSGPGATNAITGIADAMLDSTPLVVIAGQVPTTSLGTDAFQETDLVGITQPLTKWSYQIRTADEVAWAIARAFFIAQTGRPGPVVLDFTKDAQINMVDFHHEKCRFVRSYQPVPDTDPDTVWQAAAIINAAQKPLALVGQGVTLGKAEKEVMEFLEKAQIPAAETLLGLSALPSDYPLNMGMLGMHGNLAPNLKTNECDVLIAIGMRFNERVTGDLTKYARQAKIIHFDIDISELGKNVKPDVGVAGDVKQTIPAVTALLNTARHDEWIAGFKPLAEKEYETVIKNETMPQSGEIRMGEVVQLISDATRHDAVLVTDVGQNQMISARYFKFKHPNSMVTSGGLGTMGFGLPAAIGAKVGAPERTVCLFMGDGGFQMTVEELGTVMQSQIGIKMIVLNNSRLGMVRQWQQLFWKERYSFTTMMNPDFVLLGKAYGIDSRRVQTREELPGAIAEMLKDDRPYLLIVDVETEGMVYPMTPGGTAVDNVLLG
ncbi:MAG: biosynthetic-type acetolactate synthase large subunit [Prevotellaceae bacterium]|jgi:acetolactate synthase-1/2/3 large subunit|nr:biosynthetic-type acetolactate synthase large subunit [Prevotellaceae bacterium]